MMKDAHATNVLASRLKRGQPLEQIRRRNQMDFELTNTSPENENETQWVKWYDSVKKEGDSFEIKADKVIFKEENQPVFFVIDEEKGEGISVFCAHHPNAKHTDSTPHGVRLARAIGRAFQISGSVNAQALAEVVNTSTDATVRVEKTPKGVLWTVVINDDE